LASNDPCSNKDDPQCKFSPSKSILEVRILWFLVSLNSGSQIHLCVVRVFDGRSLFHMVQKRGMGRFC
jgi:hypothetical protein